MKLSDLSTMQLMNELDDIYEEIRDRQKNGTMLILNDGTVMPKYCPGCDTRPEVLCVDLNLTDEQIEVINTSPTLGDNEWDRWDAFFKREQEAGRMHFPYGWSFRPWSGIPHKAGTYYKVYCECQATDWKTSQREAEADYWWHHTGGFRLNRIPKEED